MRVDGGTVGGVAWTLTLFGMMLSWWCEVVDAQIHTFVSKEVPSNCSFNFERVFFVYGEEDGPLLPVPFVGSEKSLTEAEEPQVVFEDLKMMSAFVADFAVYRSIQVALVAREIYSDYTRLANPCCTANDVENGICRFPSMLKPPKNFTEEVGGEVLLPMDGSTSDSDEDPAISPQEGEAGESDTPLPAPVANVSAVGISAPGFYTATVIVTDNPARPAYHLNETGSYVLLLSNCGDKKGARISGRVVVKQRHGFLPGDEVSKLPLYGYLVAVYAVLELVWIALMVRRRNDIYKLHNFIALVIFFGLVECGLWFALYHSWNGRGTRSSLLFIVALVSTVVKNIFSYVLVLVASLGWGVTRPSLEKGVVMRIQAVILLYTVLETIREVALAYRHSHSLPLMVVVGCMVPVAVLNGMIFYWIISALSNLLETLHERQEKEKLQLFTGLWNVLVLSLIVALSAAVYQVVRESTPSPDHWKSNWIFSDAIGHLVFLVVLLIIMFLWAPDKTSQRFAYTSIVLEDGSEFGEEEEIELGIRRQPHPGEGQEEESSTSSEPSLGAYPDDLKDDRETTEDASGNQSRFSSVIADTLRTTSAELDLDIGR